MMMQRSITRLASARLLRVSQLALAGWLLLSVVACADETALQPDTLTPAFDLVDGGTTGDARLLFLPPLAPQRAFSGTFDASALSGLSVEICQLDGATCTHVRTFDSTTGLRIPGAAEFYQVEWQVARDRVDRKATFRITVKENGTPLGYADIVRPALAFLIRFRLEQGSSTTPQQPDLTVASVLVPSSVLMPELLAASAVITNSGAGSASATTARFAVLDASTSAELASETVAQSALAAGASATLSASFTAQFSWPAHVVVSVTTDDAGNVSESDESNNSGLSAAVAVVSPFTKTWAGEASSSWSNAANWLPAGVPTASDKVHVPAGVSNMPVLSADVTIDMLYVASGATLDIGGSGLTLTGDLSGAVLGSGIVYMSGANARLAGSVPNLEVTGSVVLSANAVVTQDPSTANGLTIVWPNASLRLNGHTMRTGDLAVLIKNGDTDGVIMQHASDVMDVTATVMYDNDAGATAATGATLSAGTYKVGSDFSIFQFSSPTATFVSSGTKTVFNGGSVHNVFVMASSATGNRLAGLETASSVSFLSDLYASGSALLGGTVNVMPAVTMTIGGDLTLQSGMTLNNSGTVQYVGTLTDLGATINGPAPVDIDP